MSTETLLDVFEPPEGMVGHSAALVAMTGTEDFLEDAVQRFTGLRPRQRRDLGSVLVYLMLDGHSSSSRQEVFPPGRIPGLHEFQPRPVDPASLVHAKVALLAFTPNRTGAPVHLRLAVLTANFTYSSARQQLELVWALDVPLNGPARVADRADMAAAGAFVETLLARRFYREEQRLSSKDRKLTERLDALLAATSAVAPMNRKPRFVHSLDRTLYDQIRERFRSAGKKPRNLLLCGSGFYEEPSSNVRKPTVLSKLENLGVFTANVQRVALVDPIEGGALAAWVMNGETEGWEVARPYDALGYSRRLHAKFVYIGYLRDGHISNGWLYLGSGNLSRRGILTHGGMVEGNIETGVVFEVDERLDLEEIERSMFWSEKAEAIDNDDWVVGEVGHAQNAQSFIEASPILSARVESMQERSLSLNWRDDLQPDAGASISWAGRSWFAVHPGDDVPLQADENPTALYVRGESGRKWLVAVVDAAGRIGWQPQRFDSYEDVLAALLDFPTRSAEAIDDGEGDDDEGGSAKKASRNRETIIHEKNYALHAAAELVEKVAALQATLCESMLDDWLDHLDRMFRASFPEQLIATWRKYRLDVFAHLRAPELRPPHLNNKQRARYLSILDAAARVWGLR